MSKEKNITEGITFIILAVLIPLTTWNITQKLEGENLISAAYMVVLPVCIFISIPLLIIGIFNLVPYIRIPAFRKRKKEKSARKCKACGSEIPAGENICPNCMVLN